jgi:hypothetical protein
VEYAQFRDAVTVVQQAHPGVDISLAWSGPAEPITLLALRTLPVLRNRGRGEAALRDVVAMADAFGAAVRLTVEPITGDDETSPGCLAGWYAAHGFVVVGDARGRPVMERPPADPGRR